MDEKPIEHEVTATESFTTLLVTHYQAIRAEILARMEMRQTVLTLYLAFVGVIFGLAAAENPLSSASVLVPFMAFGVFWIIRDHELALAHMGQWIRKEYIESLKRMGRDEYLPRWENSMQREVYGKQVLSSRYITYCFVFIGSSIAGIMIAAAGLSIDLNIYINTSIDAHNNFAISINRNFDSLPVWIVIGGAITIGTLINIVDTLKKRQRVDEH